MRTLLWPLLGCALMGCPAPVAGDTDEPGRNGLRVMLVADPGESVTRMDVRVSEVLLQATGPGGPISVGTASPVSADLVHDSVSVVLDLETGMYEDATLSLEIQGDPGLEIELAAEERAVTAVVSEPLTLVANARCLLVVQGPDQEVEFRLEVGSWLEDLNLEEIEPLEEPVVISATNNTGAYADLLDAISDTESNLDEQDSDGCD